MTQRTRNILAGFLLAVSIVTIVVFIVTHFMSPPRPAWRKDMIFFGLAAALAAGPIRGRPSRRATQPQD
jgi:hypothetical protein